MGYRGRGNVEGNLRGRGDTEGGYRGRGDPNVQCRLKDNEKNTSTEIEDCKRTEK